MNKIQASGHEHAADEGSQSRQEAQEEEWHDGNFEEDGRHGQNGRNAKTCHDFQGGIPARATKQPETLLSAMEEENRHKSSPKEKRRGARRRIKECVHGGNRKSSRH